MLGLASHKYQAREPERLFMSCRGTQQCKTTIQTFIAADALPRLKELLPVIFDQHRICALETQARILRECSLTPTLERNCVTFALPTR